MAEDVYMQFQNKEGKCLFKGDCLDRMHPGADGWIAIKSFDFTFGWGLRNSSKLPAHVQEALKGLSPEKRAVIEKEHSAQQNAKDGKSGKQDETFGKEPFRFKKIPDVTSKAL